MSLNVNGLGQKARPAILKRMELLSRGRASGSGFEARPIEEDGDHPSRTCDRVGLGGDAQPRTAPGCMSVRISAAAVAASTRV